MQSSSKLPVATYSIMYLRFLFRAFFLFLWLLSSLKNNFAKQAEAQLTDSHIVEVSSLLPPTVCNRNSTKVPNKASVEVVSRYGPCSDISKRKVKTPNYLEILRHDQARVKYIQSRIFKHKHSGSDDEHFKQTDAITVGAEPESILAPEFYMNVFLGTPGQKVSLVLDTGSEITWTQCTPCLQCYKQSNPLFDPSKSSTYSTVPCGSSACLPAFGDICDHKTCGYSILYGTGETMGIVGTDKLTIMNGRSNKFVKHPYIFGCGKNNSADFGQTSGLMGLARNPSSFITQASLKYFSYCYPSSYGSTGYITFGKTDDDKRYKFVKFTPIPTSPKQSLYYDIIVTGMAVAGKKLPVTSLEYSKSKAVIDSGTTFTSLPRSVYAALRSAFRKKMSKYELLKPVGPLDTCYDFSKYDKVVIPKISIFLKGEVELDLDVKGIMYVGLPDLSLVCLAFGANPGIQGLPSLLLGNYQLRGVEVHHDIVGERVGFGPGGCS